MRMCGIGYLIAIFGVLAAVAIIGGMADMARAADPKPRMYRIKAVFSADYCGPCKDLEAWLKRNGYPVMVKEVTSQPAVEAFPTVFYETPEHKLTSDNGQLIYNWQTVRPAKEQPVEIILWRTKQ